MQKTRRTAHLPALISFMACLWATAPLASGGYSGGGGGSFSGGVSPAPSDPTYDLGKAVYSGRSRSARGLRVCLLEASAKATPGADSEANLENDADPAKPLKLSRRSLKTFKKGSSSALTNRLVDCEDASSLASERLNPKETRALLYYLNKRFRLKLDA